MAIVLISILMNVLNSDLGFVKGFVKLDGWLRTYVLVMVVINVGAFVLIQLVHLICQPKLVWSIFISYWSYIVYQPVYNFILIVFSFCNLDDVTWGTKGLSDSAGGNSYYIEKVKFLTRWFAANTALLLVMVSINIFCGK
jgi:chitin synthase